MPTLIKKLRTLRSGIEAYLRQAVLRRSRWITSRSRDLLGNSDSDSGSAVLAVIGMEYCVETEQSFPRMALGDIKRAIALASPDTWNFVDIVEETSEQIKAIVTNVSAQHVALLDAIIWVPETTLLRRTFRDVSFASVNRDGVSYFLAGRHAARLAGGMIKTPEVFALANGLDGAPSNALSDESEILVSIRRGLALLRLRDLRFLLSPAISRRWSALQRPVIVASATVLIAYLALTSLYFAITQELRSRQLARLGTNVENLLQAQREIDLLGKRRESMMAVLRQRRSTWRVWELPAVTWRQQGGFSSLGWQDGKLTLSGNVPVATDLLETLGNTEGINEPRFSSAVRQESTGQTFSIEADTRWGIPK